MYGQQPQQQYPMQPQEQNFDFIMYMMHENARKDPKKQKHVYAMVGSIMSGVLAVAWFGVLSIPWNWLRNENIIFGCKVNLFSVKFTQGTIGWGLKGISDAIAGQKNVLSQALEELFEHYTWISDAKEVFCSQGLSQIASWLCDEWTNAWIASWVMMIFGYMGSIFLGIGGYSMYYYCKVHATEIGRKTTVTFLTLGPCCSLIGLTSYAFLTLSFGKSGNAAFNLGSENSTWGIGFIISIWLHLMSWVPMYIMMIFSKRAANEKKHGENPDEFMDLYGATGAGLSYNLGYDASGQPQQPQSSYGYGQPQAGYDSYGGQPQSSYGQQQPYSGAYGSQPQPQMGAAFPSQNQNAPGMGMAAW